MNAALVVLLVLAALLLLAIAGLVLFTFYTARRVERALPARGKIIEVAGERLHYLEAGSGSPLLLIHGLTGQLGNFAYGLLEPLAKRHRVVLIDRPGSGYSSRGRGARGDLALQAKAIAEAIDRFGLDRPVVVGHSLGGAVALALALAHPGKVRGLALVAPLTQPTTAVPPVFRLLSVRSPSARRIIAWTLATPLAILNRREVLRTVFGPDRAPPDFGVKGGGFWSMRPASYLAAAADLEAAGTDVAALQRRYGTLRLPVRILFGREDRILAAEIHGGRLAEQVPGARLDLMSGGHMIPVTAAPAVAAWIEENAAAIEKAAGPSV